MKIQLSWGVKTVFREKLVPLNAQIYIIKYTYSQKQRSKLRNPQFLLSEIKEKWKGKKRTKTIEQKLVNHKQMKVKLKADE